MCSFGSSQSSAPTTQFTTQTTTASPQAQAMYNQAWQNAQRVSQRPFQPYSDDPNAFVAPLNPVQLQGIGNIAGYQGTADPFYEVAGGFAANAGATTTPQVLDQYMNPYMGQVVNPVRQAIEQQQGQQLAKQQADAIKAGAFGGERAQLQRAQLMGQQNLGLGQALSPLYQAGYDRAVQGAQADLTRQLQAGQIMGGLGSGYQTSGLQAGKDLLGAGTVGQQTQQAGLQALYNQFLMQQQYPFQVAQFLSSTAAGLGPGYGGTTSGFQSSMQPLSYFGNPLSDPAVKIGAEGDDPEVIGSTHDGQEIYRYRVINPDTGEVGPVQIGLMADEVERRRPDAIGDYKGFRTVDYERATDDAARMGEGYAYGGSVEDILAMQKGMYTSAPPKGIVPDVKIGTAKLDSPALSFKSAPQETGKGFMANLGDAAKTLLSLYDTGSKAKSIYDERGKSQGGSVEEDDTEMTHGPTGEIDQPVAKIDTPSLSYAKPQKEEGSGLSEALSFGKTVLDIGIKALPMLMSLSDRRLKTGVRPGFADGGDFFDDLANALAGRGYIDGSTWERPASSREETSSIRSQPAVHHEVIERHHSEGVRPAPVRERAPVRDPAMALAKYEGPEEGQYGPVVKFNESVNFGAPTLPSDRFTPFQGKYGPVVGFRSDDAQLGSTGRMPSDRFTSYDREVDTGERVSPEEYARLRDLTEENRPIGRMVGLARGGSAESDDLDYLARTMVKEAGGEGDRGMEAVADVIRNRLNSGRYGSSIKDVVLAPKQFSPWNEEMRGTKADPRTLDPGSPLYVKARDIGSRVLSGDAEDMTGGATHFFNPELVSPKWARGKEGLDIGHHRFLQADAGAKGLGPVMAYAGKEQGPSFPSLKGAPSSSGVSPDSGESPAMGIAGMIRGTPAKDFSEKAGDFLTSERFIVPLLSGLGAMASSGSRYLAPAILQGVGAGAQSYMQTQKAQAEIAKEEAEALNKRTLNPKFAAEAKKTEAEASKLASEVYDRQWVPNVGWVVYDRTKPYSTPVRISDAEGKPLAGAEGVPPSNSPESNKPVPAEPAAPAPSKPEKVAAVGSALDWKPTLEAPSGVQIPGALNVAMTPELQKAQVASGQKEVDEQRAKATAAYDQQYRLDEMERQFDSLPQKGFLEAGPGAAARTDLAKTANSMVTFLGGKPIFDPDDVAAAETLAKDSTRLGFATANAIGSEPAGFIVNQAVKANPSMENSPQAFKRIVSGLREATHYEQDRLTFLQNYLNRYGTLSGADTLFRKLNPPEAYAKRAVISTIDKEDLAYLRKLPKDKIKKQKAAIDKEYGEGTTAILIGEK